MSSVFAQRFSEYMDDMELSLKDVAPLLNKKVQTISSYRTGGSRPTLEDLPSVATALGVTADWLLGISKARKWGPEIADLRLHLRERLHEVQYSDVVSHIAHIIELCQEISPLFRQDWFVAGILKLSIERYHQLMQRQGDLTDITVARFAELTGLSALYLKRARLEDLPAAPDVAEYYPSIARLHEWGVTGEELNRHVDTVRELVLRNRR